MQLPSVERQPGGRPAGADLVSSNGQRVIPVAPVNPPVATQAPEASAPPQAVAAPGVVNRIGAAAAVDNPVYNSVPDPIRRGQEPAADPRDWTIQRPEPETVEDPPPVPLHQLLLDFIKSMWQASGLAVELAQAQKQGAPAAAPGAASAPGEIARENLTYSPSRIQKNENV